MNRIILAFLAGSLTIAAAPAAFANDLNSDIRAVQQDKARFRNDYRRLQEERRELRGAEIRETYRTYGNWRQAWRADRLER